MFAASGFENTTPALHLVDKTSESPSALPWTPVEPYCPVLFFILEGDPISLYVDLDILSRPFERHRPRGLVAA